MHAAPARLSPFAAAVLDGVALVCVVAGNTLGAYLFPPAWMLLGCGPLVWVGAVIVLVRIWRWRTPQLFQTLWRHPALSGRAGSTLLRLALVTRVGVLIVGAVASISVPDRLTNAPQVSPNPIVSLPARWDAMWYLGIARIGYDWQPGHEDEQQNIAFFPAYPAALRVAGDLVSIPAAALDAPGLLGGIDARVIWGGVLASVLFFVLALRSLYRLALGDTHDAAAALRACVLLATYPFALFFSVPYSESLALLALVSLVLAWRRDDAVGGTWWGLVFGLCRSNGWSIAVALAADRLLRQQPAMSARRAWLMIAAAPLGAAIYSAYVYHLTGNPFAWAAAQHAWGGALQPVSFVTRRWTVLQQRGFHSWFRHDPTDALSFVAVAFMTAAAVWLAARREWLYSILTVAYLAPAIAIDLPAAGRMTALLFPVWIAAGRRIKGPWLTATAALFCVGQAWLAWRFFIWKTPY